MFDYSSSVDVFEGSVSGASNTFLGRIHSKNPNVNHVGKMNPNKNNKTQNANPAISKNINKPNPLIIT